MTYSFSREKVAIRLLVPLDRIIEDYGRGGGSNFEDLETPGMRVSREFMYYLYY